MTISRYETDNIVQDGKLLGTNSSILIIRQAIKSGELSVLERVTSSLERLDIIASQYYGDGRLWWIIALRNLDILKDPSRDAVAGLEIYLPSKNTAETLAGK